MAGSYLRTNYRKTGGILDIVAIGGGYPYTSQATAGKTAGSGPPHSYGGFIWLSWTGTIINASDNASVLGISSRWVESTYGLMQSYYGDTVYDSGYAFLPIIAHFMSVSGLVMTAGGVDDSFVGFVCTSFRHSGSYAVFTPLVLAMDAASDASFLSLSGATADFQIGGFIISSP